MTRRGEAGFGINGVVVATLIMTVLMGIIATMTMSSLFQGRKVTGASMNGALAESAGTKLTMALRNGLVSPVDGYTLSIADLRAVAGGSEVLEHGANAQVPDAFEAAARGFHGPAPLASVRETTGDGDGLWQVLRIVAPKAGVSRDVVVWVRTIRGDGTGVETVGTYALTLRNTPFSSYQLVSDADLAFEPAATINGNLHANGNTASRATSVVRADGPAACEGSPRVTTARGPIDATRFPGCQLTADTGRSLDLGRGAETARAAEALCPAWQASGRIRCVGAPGAGGSWDVRLEPGAVSWSCVTACSESGSLQLPSAADPARPGSVLLLRGSASISGTTNGRVTIVAWDSALPAAAGSLIAGNVTQGSADASIGIVSQGDLVVQGGAQPSCQVTTINAAMFSGTGQLTMPQDLAVAGAQGEQCPALDIVGSISGREGPMLSVSDGAGGGTGWARRTYRYDHRYRRTPPPLFPEAAQWKVSTSRVLPSTCAITPGAGTTRALTDDQARTC